MFFLRGILGLLLPILVAGISVQGGHPAFPLKTTGRSTCGRFEEFRVCGTSCPLTCDSLGEEVCCTEACVTGCFCADGYILEPGAGPSRCVPLHQCPSPGLLSFEGSSLSVPESSGKVAVTVLRLNGTHGPVSVRYRVLDPAGLYSGQTGTLEFLDGVVSRTIEIPLRDNSVRNEDVTVRLELFEPSKKTDIVAGSFILTIRDDDMVPGYLELEKAQFSFPENVGSVSVKVLRHEGSDGQIRVKYRTLPDSASAAGDFSPISGDLVFEEGVISKTVTVDIVDDTERESPEKFRLEFFDINYSPEVPTFRKRDSVLTADITILDNDMRPGSFILERPAYEVFESAGAVKIVVLRVGGSDGQIMVRYRTVAISALDYKDFVPSEKKVVFEEGETEKEITIQIVNDGTRESREDFEVRLLEPVLGPGVINFRRLTSYPKAVVSIIDDDMNPGSLVIKILTQEVLESAGAVKIVVHREGGSDGQVLVNYRTVAIHAQANLDFKPTEREVVFEEGETEKEIAIQIVNDDTRESKEDFEVQFYDPRPSPGVINFHGFISNTTVRISIKDDDMKPGFLNLERSSYEVIESAGTVTIGVVRLDGADGEMRVKYRTMPKTARASEDFEFVEDELIFKEGEERKDIIIKIIDDDARESTKAFQVELMDLTPGLDVINFRRFTTNPTATVTILDDDMKPGTFKLERSSYDVSEDAGTVKIRVLRINGADGKMSVKYRTVPMTAREHSDFVPDENELVFDEQQIWKDIVIKIVNDDIREGPKKFQVQLLDPKPGEGVINFRRFTSNPTAVVSINDDDMRPGTVQLEKHSYDVLENVGTFNVRVLRLDGQDGEIRVRYKTVAIDAVADQDFVHGEDELVFRDGQTSQDIVIQIIDNNNRESTRKFEVRLFEPRAGSGVINFTGLGPIKSSEVTILDDDMQPGFLQLNETAYQFFENVGLVRIPVVRVGGADGQIRVFYRTAAKTALTGADFMFSSGELVFREGERNRFIEIEILDDKVREETKSFVVELMNPQAAQGVINFRGFGPTQKAEVFILDDDWAVGIFELDKSSYAVAENAGAVKVRVIRSGGSDGPVSVGYRIVAQTAHPSTDFQPVSEPFVFNDGETEKTIQVPILNDAFQEPTETFEIQLLDPTPSQGSMGPRALGQKRTAVVTIFDDDGIPGFLELEEPTYVVSEKIRTLSVVVNRRGGSDGRIQCRYQTKARTALAGIDFEQGSGELIFEHGETKKIISIRIVDDKFKESIKSFEVELSNPLPDPRIAHFQVVGSRIKTLVTIADDDTNPGLIEMENPSLFVSESEGTIQVTVVRVNGSDGQIQVRYQAVSGTAREGVDFAPAFGELVFKDGEIRKTIVIQILNDPLKELTESFEVRLMDPAPGPGVLNFNGLGFTSRSVITILDDDMRHGVLQLARPNFHFSEGLGTASIEVIRVNGADGRIRVRYRTVSETALPGTDYVDTSGELIFEDGERSKSIAVRILDDFREESTEAFRVELFGASVDGEDAATFRALGAWSVSLVSIWDDDHFAERPLKPVSPDNIVFFTESSVDVPRDSDVAKYKIRREGGWTPMSVFLDTIDGTAFAGIDYKKSKGTIHFKSDEIELTLIVKLIDNPNRIGNNYFQLRLSNPKNGSLVRGKDILTVNLLGSTSHSDASFRQLIGTHVASSSSGRVGGNLSPGVPGSLEPPAGQLRNFPRGQEDCETGLIFKPCFSGCPQVCNVVADPTCSRGCVPTCVCRDGLILESLLSSKCVPPSQCPNGGRKVSGGGIIGGGGGIAGGLLGGGGGGKAGVGGGGGLLGGLLG